MLTATIEGEAAVSSTLPGTGTLRSERGASAVEYALLIAGIAALIVVAIFALGPLVIEMFNDTCTEIDSNTSVVATCDS